jgi:hypothetical protein
MTPVWCPAFLASYLLSGAPAPACPGSYLCQPAYRLDVLVRCPLVAYTPQPGDIMLATDAGWFWRLTHNLALAGHPHNSAIVVARPDGSLAILEAGPNDCLSIKMMDALPHLTAYEAKGPVWLRRRRVPLTAEQSAALSDFALKQDGKWFALPRLGGQLTIFRSRGPLRTWLLGKPDTERDGYWCSELVTTACVAAGLLDPEKTRPAATYPRDLFFDASINLFNNRHLKLAPDWDPPARWSSSPHGPASDFRAPLVYRPNGPRR